jgi:hypothetical protein
MLCPLVVLMSRTSFVESCAKFDLKVLAEFESLFPSKIEELTQYLSEKNCYSN